MEILNWKDVQHVNDICVMAPTLQLAEKAEMLIKQENYQNIDVVVGASGRSSVHRHWQLRVPKSLSPAKGPAGSWKKSPT